jgi:hypothetical protein
MDIYGERNYSSKRRHRLWFQYRCHRRRSWRKWTQSEVYARPLQKRQDQCAVEHQARLPPFELYAQRPFFSSSLLGWKVSSFGFLHRFRVIPKDIFRNNCICCRIGSGSTNTTVVAVWSVVLLPSRGRYDGRSVFTDLVWVTLNHRFPGQVICFLWCILSNNVRRLSQAPGDDRNPKFCFLQC